jgi:hypothetical protein
MVDAVKVLTSVGMSSMKFLSRQELSSGCCNFRRLQACLGANIVWVIRALWANFGCFHLVFASEQYEYSQYTSERGESLLLSKLAAVDVLWRLRRQA